MDSQPNSVRRAAHVRGVVTVLAAVACVGLRPIDARSEDDAPAIARLLDETVLAVARLEIERIDPIALAEMLGTRADAMDRISGQLSAARERLLELGASTIFSVYSLDDFGRRGQKPYLLIPADDEQAARRIAAWMFTGDPDGPTSEEPDGRTADGAIRFFEVCEPIGKVAFCGTRAARRRIEKRPKPARPGLGDALKTAADAPVVFVIAPTTDQQRVFGELPPRLPDEADGLRARDLADIQWLAVEVDPGAASVSITAQAGSEEKAERLARGLGKLVSALIHVQKAQAEVDLQARARGTEVRVSAAAGSEAGRALTKALGSVLSRAGSRFDAMQSLKQIGLAMHNFHGVWKSFPPPASYDGDKPLLSWRVYLLPYLGRRDLYTKFHLDEPWDSPHNRNLIGKMPKVYASNWIDLNLQGKTTYLLPIGKQTPMRGKTGIPIRELTDGTSNIIMVVEAPPEQAVVWTKPEDLKVDFEGNLRQTLIGGRDRVVAVFFDGAARALPGTIAQETLKALLTHQGGEAVD